MAMSGGNGDAHGSARVLEPGAAAPEGAVDAGHRPPPGRVRALAADGAPVLVRCEADDPAEGAALVALYAWLGARLFTSAHPRAARQALDMALTVRGDRAPAAVRRGLA
ncbi:hypothetical protein O4J56_05115 [Nocardiopsis sp. RSe5-2]|uniref:Uncharacterized protein n=1 Tax=Nocardiopsis endophytica TaxID=3018445 RepID=A0ABT4TZ82_9ACTN|nr:hypothetical protein [Nocardiopsis endophytica]MDA2810010.1 hypothetical protein [Nocardiopsis endophytica]